MNRLPSPVTNIGKIPPQDSDLEAAVLGAIMLEKSAITLVGAILSPQIFYLEQNRLIYEAIQALDRSGNPIDLLTVTDKLRQTGQLDVVGGPYYITNLTYNVSSSAHIEYHTRLLQEKWMKRESIKFGSELIKFGFDDMSDPFEMVDLGTKFTLDMTGNLDNGKTTELKPALVTYLEELARKMALGDKLSGIPSGIESIDRITGGWQNSDLIIIAARPAMGKTSLVTRLLLASAKAGYPCGIFSLEMSTHQLIDRFISQEIKIAAGSDLKKGKITDYEYQGILKNINKLYTLQIHIDDTAGIRLSQIRAKAYMLVRNRGVKLIVVDYLQLVEPDEGGNREQQVASLSRGLKKLAKELDIPIIALSQLSRAVETRGGDKRPQLSDLRESGSLEQDSDVVAFLYRPEYYGILQDEDGNSTEGIGELIFAKNRSGATDTAMMKWIGRYTDFMDMGGSQETQLSIIPPADQFDVGYGNRFPDNIGGEDRPF